MTELSLRERIIDNLSLCTTVYQKAEDYGLIELVAHPFKYADVLIRLDYEPFPPIEQSSILNFYTPRLLLPGIVPYAQYLYLAEGFPGIFRCVWPCIGSKVVSTSMYRYAAESLCPVQEEPSGDVPRLSEQFTTENLSYYLKDQGWTLGCKMLATIASHPFHVVGVRCMAQFVSFGQEEAYKFPMVCIIEIYKTEGISGFFSGLIPRLFGDLMLTSATAFMHINLMHGLHLLGNYVGPRTFNFIEKLVPILANRFATPYANRLYNVSDIMIVNGTSQLIGNPPFTPAIYRDWFDCWVHLRRDKLSKDSSGYFSRLYRGPYTERANGMLTPRLDTFGPTYFPKPGQPIPYLLKDYYTPLMPMYDFSTKLETFKDIVLSNDVIMSALHDINSM